MKRVVSQPAALVAVATMVGTSNSSPWRAPVDTFRIRL
jgi:hypothetical protein